MGNETVKTYVINKKKYDIVGCWDEDTPEGKYDFFDVFDEDGSCLNLGAPYYAIPSRVEVKELIEELKKYDLLP